MTSGIQCFDAILHGGHSRCCGTKTDLQVQVPQLTRSRGQEHACQSAMTICQSPAGPSKLGKRRSGPSAAIALQHSHVVRWGAWSSAHVLQHALPSAPCAACSWPCTNTLRRPPAVLGTHCQATLPYAFPPLDEVHSGLWPSSVDTVVHCSHDVAGRPAACLKCQPHSTLVGDRKKRSQPAFRAPAAEKCISRPSQGAAARSFSTGHGAQAGLPGEQQPTVNLAAGCGAESKKGDERCTGGEYRPHE